MEIGPGLQLPELVTHDSLMKLAQVNGYQMCSEGRPCSAVLADESQDFDACQIQWLDSQANHGCQVFLVGDAAQSIFSFRGARVQHWSG